MASTLSSQIPASVNPVAGSGLGYNGDQMMYRCKYGETSKLTHYNYSRWKRDIEFFLQAESALGIVLGDEIHPGAGRGAGGSEFDRKSGKAAAMINASCHSSVKTYINGMRDPHLMWEELKTKLDTSNTRAGRTAILRHFNQLRPNPGSSIAEYITLLLDCRQELEGSEQAIQDETFITHLVTTLPAECNSIVDIITHQPIERQTIDYVIATLVEWETSRRNRKLEVGSNASAGTTMTSGNALNVSSQHGRSWSFVRSWPKRKPRASFASPRSITPGSVTCWYWNKKGHQQANCFTKRRAERGRSERTSAPKRGFVQPNDSDESAFASVRALMAMDSTTLHSNISFASWLVDSGASHHMCTNAHHFSSIHRLPKPVKISLGDGSQISAFAAGTVSLTLPTKTISFSALYIPRLAYSLLSVSQLSECAEYSVYFHSQECYLRDRSKTTGLPGENTHLLGCLRNGLYEVCLGRQVGSRFGSALGSMRVAANTSLVRKVSLKRWHERLAHLNFDSIKMLVPPSAYNSDPVGPDLCPICIKAKHQRQITRTPVERTSRPFQLVHSDLCGPIQPESASGFRYFIVYIDDFSRSVWVYFLRTKTAVEVVSVFQELLASLDKKYPEWPVTRFRCDNGRGEYDNSLFRGILRVSGISFEPSPPYTQHKNGVSERMIRTLVTKAWAMLLDSQLPDMFWAEAINTAAYLHDRSPSRPLSNKTPYEVLQNKKPEISHFRRFGCAAYKLIPNEQRVGKFTERAQECTFLGYVHDTSKIWRLWEPHGKRVIQASDVTFDENRILGDTVRANMELDTSILGSIIPGNLPIEEDDLEALAPSPEFLLPVDTSTSKILSNAVPVETASNTSPSPSTAAGSSSVSASTTMPEISLRRSARLRYPSLGQSAAVVANLQEAGTPDTEGDPLSYREALSQSCSVKWKNAMQEEFASLLQNHTWDYVDSVPADANSIGCRWVFRKKINPDGSVRFKARLVIKGYEQIPGVDFGDTFAPVAKLTSLRLILGHAILNGWETHHMDVVTAFLNPPLDNSVFMDLPEGIEFLAKLPQRISACRLKKALYGLKQAPRLWYRHIHSFLTSVGFSLSANDPNLYLQYKPLPDSDTQVPAVILLLYVDDILITARNLQAIEEVKALLQAKYSMNDLGRIQQFLGLEV